jgi:hypothetical protein
MSVDSDGQKPPLQQIEDAVGTAHPDLVEVGEMRGRQNYECRMMKFSKRSREEEKGTIRLR